MIIDWKSPLEGVPAETAFENHMVWSQIERRFRPHEFHAPYEMDTHFLLWLYDVREDAGVPFKIISDARDIDGDVGAGKSAHKKRPCRAVDIQVYSSLDRGKIIIAATLHGCRRIGVYPGKDRTDEEGWPPHARDASGLHLDCSTHPDNRSPRIWTKY